MKINFLVFRQPLRAVNANCLSCVAIFLLLNTSAKAEKIEHPSQLVGLPAFCMGTASVRVVSQDKTPFEEYIKKYGDSYRHLHHYCWALLSEKIAFQNPNNAKFQLMKAIGDINYVLENNHDPKFIFLPEMYVAKARMYFKLDNNVEAVLNLKKAIEAKPDYVPAITRLADHYIFDGDIQEAVKIIKTGITYSPNSNTLKKKLAELIEEPGKGNDRH